MSSLRVVYSVSWQSASWRICEYSSNTLFTRYNRLSNQLYNRFHSLTTGLTTVLNEQPLFAQLVVKPGLTTVLNEQLFIQPVVKPRCTTGFTTVLNEQTVRSTRLWNRLHNPFDNNFDNRVERTATVRSTVLNEQPLFVQPCWTNSHCSFNRVEWTATVRSTGCQTGLYNWFDNRLHTRYSHLSNRYNRFDNRFHNGFDNRLYRVYNHLPSCQTPWQPVWQQVVSCKRGLTVPEVTLIMAGVPDPYTPVQLRFCWLRRESVHSTTLMTAVCQRKANTSTRPAKAANVAR